MEEQLIVKVKGYDCLYNTKHKNYRDSSVRQIAWEEIGEAFHMTGHATKQMWDKLRRCYTNARNRSLEAKRNYGAFSNKKGGWKFEEHMSFLLPFLEARTSRKSPRILYETKYIEQPDQTIIGMEGNEPVFEEIGIQYVQNEPQGKKRKEPRRSSTQHQMYDNLEGSTSRRRKNNFEESKSVQGLDETDLFFLSMSRMTKQLPKVEQSQIKLKLSDLVFSAEVRNCIKSEPPSSTRPPTSTASASLSHDLNDVS